MYAYFNISRLYIYIELSNHITLFEVIFDFFLFDTIQDIFSYLYICIYNYSIYFLFCVLLCGSEIRTFSSFSIEIQLDKSKINKILFVQAEKSEMQKIGIVESLIGA